VSTKVDDLDCELCPDCRVAPGCQGGCACPDDGRGSLPARFEALRAKMHEQNEALRREAWKASAPVREAARELARLLR
jgi:hypothetical protein